MDTEEVRELLFAARSHMIKHPVTVADADREPFGAFRVADCRIDLLFCRERAQDLRARLMEVEPELHALRRNIEVLATDLAIINTFPCDADQVGFDRKEFAKWRARLERIAEGGDF